MKPWDSFPRAECYPDCTCEFMDTTSWILQPIAFWSSLAYLLPIYFLSRKVKDKTPVFHVFCFAFVILTLSSMFCHASFTMISGALDFACIAAIMGYFSFIHFCRLGKTSKLKLYISFILFLGILTAGMYALNDWIKIALCMGVFLFAFYEIYLKKGNTFISHRSLQLSIIILNVSFLFFLLDEKRIILCDPQGWIHGHTIWHLGTAWSAYYFGKWRFIDETF